MGLLWFQKENARRDCSVSFRPQINWKQRELWEWRRREWFLLCLTVNPRWLSCGLAPECVQVPQVAVSKESGGRKEAAQHFGSQAGSTGRRCTRTHSMQRRRQNVKAASGRQLLVPLLLSAWRLRWSWVASRGPMRLNSLKMSKHLRGVRAVPGPDNHQPSCAAHTLTNLGGNLSHSCVTFSVKCFGL